LIAVCDITPVELSITISIKQPESKIVSFDWSTREQPIHFDQKERKENLSHIIPIRKQIVKSDSQRVITVVEYIIEVIDNALTCAVNFTPPVVL
jgi:hypothetical protein